MRKLWKGVLLGAAVGGAGKAVQEVRGEGSIEDVGPAVAKAAGQAAVAGATVGFLLDRRDRRKLTRLQRAKAKASIGGVVAGAAGLAEAARPHLQTAAETARKKGLEAAEVAKPHAVAAAEVARKKALEAAEVAKPHAVAAADLAKVRAEKAGKAAKAKLADLDMPVLVAV
jgi:hypothetical protein